MDDAGPRGQEAVERALRLLADPPGEPETSHGYLDLLGAAERRKPGPVQALWESNGGSALYDSAQSLARGVFTTLNPPFSTLGLEQAGTALDIGSGPGSVTSTLGRYVGARGLALGVDVSESMLRRAVRDYASANVGFIRADARRLPFRDACFDVVTCLAVLQLVPDPLTIVAEAARVLVPGGKVAIMVPSPGGRMGRRLGELIAGPAGLWLPTADEIAEVLTGNGVTIVHSRQSALVLRVEGTKAG
ncbi:hypothetical protein BAY61_23060 [Prauserella marina]|uniref:Ubiquinone/menaquinone biosynthesis C-methylase UbiE n=1 Tax=Prauserella marina TaxID=530584 RepID=A0A222VU13_9PSEU|nr:class I SAM-dependent methyltransferase [Prauserella marina]ASR37404.1 hypothetical protein BAY61_23060 [Prauserella marina]PWV74720.1 ubiquinone/menaquinone biosynthesis C-methylase UbiE [Prauserella marina]SDD42474.1 Ubiquinone/menaquinone biosynthesis C-methylase UbiE [Prauserella marina]